MLICSRCSPPWCATAKISTWYSGGAPNTASCCGNSTSSFTTSSSGGVARYDTIGRSFLNPRDKIDAASTTRLWHGRGYRPSSCMIFDAAEENASFCASTQWNCSPSYSPFTDDFLRARHSFFTLDSTLYIKLSKTEKRAGKWCISITTQFPTTF